jgi:hypothetical protein
MCDHGAIRKRCTPWDDGGGCDVVACNVVLCVYEVHPACVWWPLATANSSHIVPLPPDVGLLFCLCSAVLRSGSGEAAALALERHGVANEDHA